MTARLRSPKRTGSVFARVQALVRRIPRGKVATYGQLSQLVDGRVTPVGIGWALRAAPEGSVPWQRVVNAQGRLSTERAEPGLQRVLLRAEGVRIGDDGQIDLARYQWWPRGRPRRTRAARRQHTSL